MTIVLAVIGIVAFTGLALVAWYLGTPGRDGSYTRFDSHLNCSSKLDSWLGLFGLVVAGAGVTVIGIGAVFGVKHAETRRSWAYPVVVVAGMAMLACAFAIFFLVIQIGYATACD